MALPEIIETKRTLTGEQRVYHCRVVERSSGALVVLFISDRAMHVGGLDLPPGTVTFGYFWADRPYNAYHWMQPGGTTLGVYFNLADETNLDDEGAFSWRDLAVDVLLRPGMDAVVLDEDQLPPSLPRRDQIERATRALVAAAPAIVAALEQRTTALWPRVFGGARR